MVAPGNTHRMEEVSLCRRSPVLLEQLRFWEETIYLLIRQFKAKFSHIGIKIFNCFFKWAFSCRSSFFVFVFFNGCFLELVVNKTS